MEAFSPITLQTDAKTQLALDIKSLLRLVLIPILGGYNFLYFFNEYTFAWFPFFAILGFGIGYLAYLIFQDTTLDQTLHFQSNGIEIRKGNRLVKLIHKADMSFQKMVWKPTDNSDMQAIVIHTEAESLIIGSLSHDDNEKHAKLFVDRANYFIASEKEWAQFHLWMRNLKAPINKEKEYLPETVPMLATV